MDEWESAKFPGLKRVAGWKKRPGARVRVDFKGFCTVVLLIYLTLFLYIFVFVVNDDMSLSLIDMHYSVKVLHC